MTVYDGCINFVTLGPEGTCHENAVKLYASKNHIEEYKISFIYDFCDSVSLCQQKNSLIVQNAAHPQVSIMMERFRDRISVIDTFIAPTKEMGIIKRKYPVKGDRSLSLMPAARHYIDDSKWQNMNFEISNPIVLRNLLQGSVDYGVTFVHYVQEYPTELEVYEDFGGPVDTVWIVYGCYRRKYEKAILTEGHETIFK